MNSNTGAFRKKFGNRASCLGLHCVFAIWAFLSPCQAETQVAGVSVEAGMVYPNEVLVVNLVLVARPAERPLTVDLYLISAGGEGTYLGSESFSVEGNRSARVVVPEICDQTASGWRIYAEERRQVRFGSFSYSAPFSIYQGPSQLEFAPLSNGQLVAVGRNRGVVRDATDLRPNEVIWFRFGVRKIGCAVATGFRLRQSLDGGPFSNYPLNDVVGEGVASLDFFVDQVSPGQHVMEFALVGPDGRVLTTTSKPFAISAAPTISKSPQDVTLVEGSGAKAVFRVEASGAPEPEYQWYLGSDPIANARSNTYVIANPALSDQGVYWAKVWNLFGTNQSTPGILTVQAGRPSLVKPSIESDGSIRLLLSGWKGRVYQVEWSNDFTEWFGLGRFTNTSPTSIVVDARPQSAARAFYRAVVVR